MDSCKGLIEQLAKYFETRDQFHLWHFLVLIEWLDHKKINAVAAATGFQKNHVTIRIECEVSTFDFVNLLNFHTVCARIHISVFMILISHDRFSRFSYARTCLYRRWQRLHHIAWMWFYNLCISILPVFMNFEWHQFQSFWSFWNFRCDEIFYWDLIFMFRRENNNFDLSFIEMN